MFKRVMIGAALVGTLGGGAFMLMPGEAQCAEGASCSKSCSKSNASKSCSDGQTCSCECDQHGYAYCRCD